MTDPAVHEITGKFTFNKVECLLVGNELPVNYRHFSLIIDCSDIKIFEK